MTVADEAEELIRRIENQATMFVIDNIRGFSHNDIMMIKNAMLIGASIQGELQLKRETDEALKVSNSKV
jgi:hypothetical protein